MISNYLPSIQPKNEKITINFTEFEIKEYSTGASQSLMNAHNKIKGPLQKWSAMTQ